MTVAITGLKTVAFHTKHPGRFPNAHPFHHAGPANARVHFHVVHP